ncbi:hypothetical protein [Streptomyces sp. NPDC057580]|uniref:hypothetical protein n=1 Tax=Streptomyces sp. NPDC057580 TaxID=3346173 RepID=UPI00369E462E
MARVEQQWPYVVTAVMGRPKLYTAAQKASRLGRIAAGRDGKISHLPAPFDGWSDSRDTPAPPRRTFREWYASQEGRRILADAASGDVHDTEEGSGDRR